MHDVPLPEFLPLPARNRCALPFPFSSNSRSLQLATRNERRLAIDNDEEVRIVLMKLGRAAPGSGRQHRIVTGIFLQVLGRDAQRTSHRLLHQLSAGTIEAFSGIVVGSLSHVFLSVMT